MRDYKITFSLPGIKNSPSMAVHVEALDEDDAIDRGFDEAFRTYPQFGGFQVDAVEVAA